MIVLADCADCVDFVADSVVQGLTNLNGQWCAGIGRLIVSGYTAHQHRVLWATFTVVPVYVGLCVTGTPFSSACLAEMRHVQVLENQTRFDGVIVPLRTFLLSWVSHSFFFVSVARHHR